MHVFFVLIKFTLDFCFLFSFHTPLYSHTQTTATTTAQRTNLPPADVTYNAISEKSHAHDDAYSSSSESQSSVIEAYGPYKPESNNNGDSTSHSPSNMSSFAGNPRTTVWSPFGKLFSHSLLVGGVCT